MEKAKRNSSADLLKNFEIGFITSVITQPFEVLRTSSISSFKNTKGVIGLSKLWKLSKKIYSQEGFSGFFRGCGLSILKNGVSCTIFFTGLQNIDKEFKKRVPKKWIYQNPKNMKQYVVKGALSFLNAGLSKILTTFVVTPIILVKTRFEVVGKTKNSISREVKHIYQKSGIRGFYKGLIPTLLRDVPWSGFQYSIYSLLMAMSLTPSDSELKKKILVPLMGGLSSIIAVCLTFPFDNVRVRLQIEDSTRKSIYQLIKLTVITEGVTGLYKGILPRILKKGFGGAVLWVIYQNIWQQKKMKEN